MVRLLGTIGFSSEFCQVIGGFTAKEIIVFADGQGNIHFEKRCPDPKHGVVGCSGCERRYQGGDDY